MAYEGYLTFAGVEIVNHARVATYAAALGIDAVRLDPASTDWIRQSLNQPAYTTPANDIAPWYDPNVPASAEFAGVALLNSAGLGDSTLTSTVTEYVTDGASLGRPRNAALPMVFSVALAASTERGAEYGLRWLKRVLRHEGCAGISQFCAGMDLGFYRYAHEVGGLLGTGAVDPVAWGKDAAARYRDVRCTVGAKVTRRRRNECSTVWTAQFTLTAGDPYQYGQQYEVFNSLGGSTPAVYDTGYTGTSGHTVLLEQQCPVYDWLPVHDPLHPGLIAPPIAPNFYPDGWSLPVGHVFDRWWATVPNTAVPADTGIVPVFTIKGTFDARMIRVRVYNADNTQPTDICTPLWETIITYIPGGQYFYIDGVQQAAYTWDGVSGNVRRADALVYSTNARPMLWPSFSCGSNLRVTLEAHLDSGDPTGPTDLRLAAAFVPKGD